MVILSILMFVVYQVFHLLFGSRSRHSLVALTRRSFIQKDVKVGLRRLIYRLREGIQVLEPFPGLGGEELVFRDVTNQKIRIRREDSENRLISEKDEAGNWVREDQPTMVTVGTGSLPASLPVKMENCSSLHFTVLSPECVSIRVGLLQEIERGSFMTIVKLRNSSLAY